MEFYTNIQNPFWAITIVIALVIATVYTVYFYRRKQTIYSKIQRLTLSITKFIYALLLSILVLSPLVEIIKNLLEKPMLVLAVDNSSSIANDEENARFVRAFISDIKNEAGQKFDIETILFGEQTLKSDSVDFSFLRSNYTSFFRDAEKRYYNRNVGAYVMIGDGIYNEGPNPAQVLKGLNAPVFTLAIGDTIPKTDQSIINVAHNPNVFLGNSFPVEVEAGFTEFPYQSTQISVYLAGKLIKSEQVSIPQPDFYYRNTYYIDADKAGLQNVTVVISPVHEEENTDNNRHSFTIEVHDNKKKVLMLSEGPHPDIGAITETLEKQANYQVSTAHIAQFNKNINDYDLLVLNQLPARSNQNMAIFDTIKNSSIPLLIIVGQRTSLAALNNLNRGITMTPGLQTEESSAWFNENFALFSLPSKIKNVEEIYPPLISRYTGYELDGNYSVIAHQKIKDIEMNYPLIAAGENDQRKTAIIFGEGIWRWRLREFQYFDHQDAFNHLFVNIFNYLSLEEKQEQFKISYERIVSETNRVEIRAQVFNEVFEAVTNAEVNFTLSDSTGNELNYVFDSQSTGYRLNLGLLPPGHYDFEASVTLGDKDFLKQGRFSVQEVNIENQNILANFNVLNNIAGTTGGQFFTSNNYQQLIELVKNSSKIKPRVYQEKSINELIDWKIYALIILTLMSLEWFLRKFWGGY
ncbi:MAG: hypothetical protein JXR50_08785 [Prolixibacteraceae bacterium]|nr:hypothetical protein [Prolixibacteraceae bacterium]MBN2649820.1 hypothetical protein [Prolixibacteraceae bacterium]